MNEWFDWLADPGSRRLFLRAVATCAMLGIGAGPIGCALVARRMSLTADALAHSLLPGVGLAWLLFGASLPALYLGGLAAGLATALAAGLASRWAQVKEDASLAAWFTTLFAVGVLLASKAAAPGDLEHLLFGDVLAAGDTDLRLAAAVLTLDLVVFALGYRAILLECFDPAFHRAGGGRSTLTHLGLLTLTVINLVAALHALGVVLALGLFMLPAVTASLWCNRWGMMLVASALIAVAGSAIGFTVSWRFALASGPAMVATLGAAFVISLIIAPHGIIARRLRPHCHDREETHETCEVPAIDGDQPT